jgi:hypothetical protein
MLRQLYRRLKLASNHRISLVLQIKDPQTPNFSQPKAFRWEKDLWEKLLVQGQGGHQTETRSLVLIAPKARLLKLIK